MLPAGDSLIHNAGARGQGYYDVFFRRFSVIGRQFRPDRTDIVTVMIDEKIEAGMFPVFLRRQVNKYEVSPKRHGKRFAADPHRGSRGVKTGVSPRDACADVFRRHMLQDYLLNFRRHNFHLISSVKEQFKDGTLP